MADNIANIVETIASSGKTSLYFNINENDSYNANLKNALNFSGEKLVSGFYLAPNSKTGNNVKVNLVVAQTPQIDIKVSVSAGESIDLCASTENGGNWVWEILGAEGKINWGDGQEVVIKNSSGTNMAHTYSSAGEYTISLFNINFCGSTYAYSGSNVSFASLMNSEAYVRADLKSIIEIDFKTPQLINNINAVFAGLAKCEKISGCLLTTPEAVNNSTGQAGFKALFCTFKNSLLLNNISNLTIVWNTIQPLEALQFTFKSCNALTYDGVKGFKILNMDKTKVLNYQHTFANCIALTRVPKHLMSPYATKLHSCFHGAGIEFLPAGVLDSASEEQHTFALCPLKHVSTNLKLDNLRKGLAIFENSYFGYKEIETIYNALPVYPGGNNSISMGVYCSEEEKGRIRTLLNIDKASYYEDKGLPSFNHSQLDSNNSKGWPIGFNIHPYPGN